MERSGGASLAATSSRARDWTRCGVNPLVLDSTAMKDTRIVKLPLYLAR